MYDYKTLNIASMLLCVFEKSEAISIFFNV